MAEMKELHVTNLHEVFEPKAIISDIGRKDRWRKVTYETTDFSGTALSALRESRPGDIAYDPHLTGWYKIYIQCIPLPDFRLQLLGGHPEGFLRRSTGGRKGGADHRQRLGPHRGVQRAAAAGGERA